MPVKNTVHLTFIQITFQTSAVNGLRYFKIKLNKCIQNLDILIQRKI